MSKLTKVLSVLLALTLLLSTASIGVEALYSAYKDSAITRYDTIDRPVLSPAQYASMAMDEVDRMLGEANIKIEYDVAGMFGIDADFTSVDKALYSVGDLYNKIKGIINGGINLGDANNINFSALVDANGVPVITRGTAGKTDADIFLALLKFLKDNAAIIAKVPKGSTANGGLDLGILSGFVDLGDKLDVPKMAKEFLAGFVWPDTAKEKLDLSKTVDEYVRLFIEEFLSGDYAKFTNGISALKKYSDLCKKYVPGVTDKVDFLNDSVYDILNKCIKIALNDVLIEYTNPRVLALLGRLCGYDYTKTKDADGDTIWVRTEAAKREDEPNAMVNVINWHEDPATGKITGYQLQKFPIESWGNDWIFDHLNDILGQIVDEVLTIDVNWDYSGNSALKDNIITTAKAILSATGDALFARYIEVLTPEEIDELTEDQFLAYVLRSVLNASISFVYIENDCDSVLSVLFELVKQFAADFVPSADYSDLDADLDGIMAMGLDMAAYGLNGISNMDLEYGLDVDEFADACVDWLLDNYGGFLPSVEGTDGWEKVSYVLFNLIPANWLSTYEDGSLRNNVKDLILDDVVDKVLNFDVDELLTLVDKNPTGELNNKLIKVLLARITDIVNFILPGVFPPRDYTTLEMLLDPNLLSTIIQNLLNTLYDRASNGLMEALLPVVCAVLDLSDPETFGYPYISLEDQHTVGQTLLTSFYMYNGSSGLNTNATDKYGNKTQDALYKYYIRNVKVSNPAVSVSPNANIYINGGTSQTFTLDNVSAALNSILKVTVTYDVLSEKGTVMTPNPLTATTYTYIYDSVNAPEDNIRTKADTQTPNMHLVYYKPTTYLSTEDELGSLVDYAMDMQRNKSSDSSIHQKDATFSVDRVTIDSRLAAKGVTANLPFSVSTTKNPSSAEYKPYKIANAEEKLSAGTYNNSFQFKATPSHSAEETITFSHNIFVYDDFGLNSLLKNAVSADRQEANYAKTGGHEAKYLSFGVDPKELPEEPERKYDDNGDETPESAAAYAAYLAEIEPYYDKVTGINGAAAWNRYVAAVDAAAAIVYAPRQVSRMANFVSDGAFETAAEELYVATKQLEGCSLSGGTDGIRSALEAIVAPNTYIDDKGKEKEYDYDDARYNYFGRADYVNYTYGNFKGERKTAEGILDKEEAAKKKGEDYQIEAIRAAYVAHRVSLYGERLVRIRAYTTYLNEAIEKYTPLYNGGNDGVYSNKTWKEFQRWYEFATQVSGEPIGSTIGRTENLAGDGLRQTRVNEARAQLVKAAKRLEPARPLVDYTQIQAMIEEAEATYTAGNAEGTYTALTWTAFEKAYEEAVAIVEDELEESEANQRKVDDKYDALRAAFDGLVEISDTGTWDNFTDDEDLHIKLTPIVSLYSEMNYLTGLSFDYVSVSDYLNPEGCYTIEVTPNSWDMESTGAVFSIYKNGELFDEYTIVLYGDIDGDGVADNTDYSEMYMAMGNAGKTEWEFFACADENPQAMAADLDHDAVVDGTDGSILLQIMGYVIVYNQSWQDGEDIVL